VNLAKLDTNPITTLVDAAEARFALLKSLITCRDHLGHRLKEHSYEALAESHEPKR